MDRTYGPEDLVKNVLRHLERAERHAVAREWADAMQRLGSAIDNGAKWYLHTYEPERTFSDRGFHTQATDEVIGHAGLIAASACSSDALASNYPHSLGSGEANPIKAVKVRIESARTTLGPKWEAVKNTKRHEDSDVSPV